MTLIDLVNQLMRPCKSPRFDRASFLACNRCYSSLVQTLPQLIVLYWSCDCTSLLACNHLGLAIANHRNQPHRSIGAIVQVSSRQSSWSFAGANILLLYHHHDRANGSCDHRCYWTWWIVIIIVIKVIVLEHWCNQTLLFVWLSSHCDRSSCPWSSSRSN